MDGHETFRALQDVDATVRVVLSSGYAEQDAASIFSVAELAGFIQKPYTAEELIATVRTVLGS
jgi:DNA-binding NtrC family response regulator